MKLRSILLTAVLTVVASSIFIACAKSGDDGGAQSLPPVPVTPPNVTFNGGRIGFYAQNAKMDRMYVNMGTSYNMGPGMMSVLKTAMRTCDRDHVNSGLTSCSAFLNGFNDIMIFANGSQATSAQMVLRTMVDTSCQSPYYCSQYWVSLPSFKQVILGLFGFNTFNYSNVYNPMVLNMAIWPINNSKGFELRGYAPGNDLYYNSGGLLFQFQVLQGKLEDPAWDYKLIFNGSVAATGRMARCPSTNCGVTGY